MKTARRSVAVGISFSEKACLLATAAIWLVAPFDLRADARFLSHSDTRQDIDTPTQRAIILYDQWEDMLLQAKYEGLAEDFGWLIPVPGLPEVRQGSMRCFNDLSQLTQEAQWLEEAADISISSGPDGFNASLIKAVEIKTIGAFEVTVLSAQDTTSLSEWLAAHDFVLPKQNRSLLD